MLSCGSMKITSVYGVRMSALQIGITQTVRDFFFL